MKTSDTSCKNQEKYQKYIKFKPLSENRLQIVLFSSLSSHSSRSGNPASICAKTLNFVIVTLDRLFQKSGAAFSLIFIFWSVSGCQSCQKLHFLTLEVSKQGKKSNYQKFPHNFFEEPYEDIACKILDNFVNLCSLYNFFFAVLF